MVLRGGGAGGRGSASKTGSIWKLLLTVIIRFPYCFP